MAAENAALSFRDPVFPRSATTLATADNMAQALSSAVRDVVNNYSSWDWTSRTMTSPPNVEHFRVTTERSRSKRRARNGRPIFPPLIMERHPVGCESAGSPDAPRQRSDVDAQRGPFQG
jgi:hypothetical protein